MRELILKMSISIDGFVAAADGGKDWILKTASPDGQARIAERISNASLHIRGAATFRDMAGFWPTSASPLGAPMNAIPKAVFTRQGPAILEAAAAGPPGESWRQAHVAGGDLSEEINRLKAQDGLPIIAHGGAGFARSLIAADLVDQYALTVHPVALGSGEAIFSSLGSARRLTLVSSTPSSSGVLAQVYRPA